MDIALSVTRPEFDSAFKLIKKLCKARAGEEAVLSFDAACLHIEAGGMTVAPAAQGHWPGQARVPARFFIGLAKLPPAGETIEFRIESGHLRVGTSMVKCVWQPAWSRIIDLPENASHAEILALPQQHELFDIEASGYGGILKDSLAWREARIAAACQALAAFGVTREEIDRLVDDALRRNRRS